MNTNNNTMYSKAVFGRKAFIETEASSSLTTSYSKENDAAITLRYDLSKTGISYIKVDFLDRRKMDICRKLNKLLGGY